MLARAKPKSDMVFIRQLELVWTRIMKPASGAGDYGFRWPGHFPVTSFVQNGVFTTKEKLGLVPDVELHARRSCHEDFL